MKKFLGIITVAAALFAATFPLSAQAQAAAPAVDYVMINSTVAAADAAISVGPYDVSGAEDVTFQFKNGGSGARTAILECWDPSGVQTTHAFASVAVGATDTATVWMSPRATGTAPAKYTFLPVDPSTCVKLSARAAAATGTMRVVATKRKGR